jgi:hypothetical protein
MDKWNQIWIYLLLTNSRNSEQTFWGHNLLPLSVCGYSYWNLSSQI